MPHPPGSPHLLPPCLADVAKMLTSKIETEQEIPLNRHLATQQWHARVYKPQRLLLMPVPAKERQRKTNLARLWPCPTASNRVNPPGQSIG